MEVLANVLDTSERLGRSKELAKPAGGTPAAPTAVPWDLSAEVGSVRSLSVLLNSMMGANDLTVAQLQSTLSDANARVIALEEELAVLEQRRSEASANALNGELRIAVLTAEVSHISDRLHSATRVADTVSRERNQLAVEAQRAKLKLADAENQLAAQAQRLEHLTKEAEGHASSLAAAMGKLTIALERGDVERRNNLELTGQLHDCSRSVAHHEETIRSLRAQLVAANHSRSTAESQLSLSLQRFQQVEEVRRRLELDAAEHNAVVANLKYAMEDLRRDRSALQDKVDQVSSQLHKVESNKLSLMRQLESSAAKIAALEDIRRLQERMKTSKVGVSGQGQQRLSHQGTATPSPSTGMKSEEPSVLELLFRDSQCRTLELEQVVDELCVRIDELSSALQLQTLRCCEAEAKCRNALFDHAALQVENERVTTLKREHGETIRKLEGEVRRLESDVASLRARGVRAEADKLTANEQADRARQELDAVLQRTAVSDLNAAVVAKKLRALHEELSESQAKHNAAVAQLEAVSSRMRHAESERQLAVSSAESARRDMVDLAAKQLHGELVTRELELKLSAATDMHNVALVRAVDAEMMVMSTSKTVASLEGEVSLLSRRLHDSDHRCRTLQQLAQDADSRRDELNREHVELRKLFIQRVEELRRAFVEKEEAAASAESLACQVQQLLTCIGLLEHRCRTEESIRQEMSRRVRNFTSGADVLTKDEAKGWLERITGDVITVLKSPIAATTSADSVPSGPVGSDTLSHALMFRSFDVQDNVHLHLLEYVARGSLFMSEATERSSIAALVAAASGRALRHLTAKLDVVDCVITQCLRFVEGTAAQNYAAAQLPELFSMFNDLVAKYQHCAVATNELIESCTISSSCSSTPGESPSSSVRLLRMLNSRPLSEKSLPQMIHSREEDSEDPNCCSIVSMTEVQGIFEPIKKLLVALRRQDEDKDIACPDVISHIAYCDEMAAQFAISADTSAREAERVEKVNNALREANSELLQRWEIVCDGHMYASATVLNHMRDYVEDIFDTISNVFVTAKEGLLVVAQRSVLLELAMERTLPQVSGGSSGVLPTNKNLAAMGARAFMRLRIRMQEAETQTPIPLESVDSCAQTEAWVDAAWTAQVEARDNALAVEYLVQDEGRLRLETAQMESISFAQLVGSEQHHQRMLMEATKKAMDAEMVALRRQMDEEIALSTKATLHKSSEALAQATQRLKVALDHNTALELEVQRCRRELRSRSGLPVLSVSAAGASDARGLRVDSSSQTVLEAPEAETIFFTAASYPLSTPPPPPPLPPPVSDCETMAQRVVVLETERAALLADVESANADAAALRQQLVMIERSLGRKANRVEQAVQATDEPRTAVIVTPLRSDAVELPFSSRRGTAGLVQSSNKWNPSPNPDEARRERSPISVPTPDGGPGNNFSLDPHQLQQRQLLLTLSRSEREARYQLQEAQSQLVVLRTFARKVTRKYRALVVASRRMECELMATHDQVLVDMQRRLFVMEISTQTAVEEFPTQQPQDAALRGSSILKKVGSVLGGRR